MGVDNTFFTGNGRDKIVIEEDASGNPLYIGRASPGAATSATVWTVTRVVRVVGATTITTYTTASGSFDNRAALTYV